MTPRHVLLPALLATVVAMAACSSDSRSPDPTVASVASPASGASISERSDMRAAASAPFASPAARASSPAPAPPVAAAQGLTLGGGPGAFAIPGSMLVRSGRASVQVDSLERGIGRIRELARTASAVVGNTTVQSGREQLRSATLELRVPSDRFDDVIAGLRGFGTVEAVDVTVSDVGEEYVDVGARVATARQLERRLIDLLATRTGKLADVLQVENELARVRGEIERYEGRLRYLRERSAVSTLAITVHESIPVIANHPGTNPITEAMRQAWRNFVAVLATVIASLGVLIPLGAIATAAVLLGRRWIGRRVTLPQTVDGV